MAEEKEPETRAVSLNKLFGFDDMSVEDVTTLAKCAERAECFEDMVIFTRTIVEKRLALCEAKKNEVDEVLLAEERNLFSVAYKNVVGMRRQGWRSLSDNEDGNEFMKVYQEQVASEIESTCLEIQGLLQKLANAAEAVQKNKEDDKKDDNWVFYKKMMGDYYRYLREVFEDNDEYKNKTKENYDAAMEKAKDCLAPTNPTRLGLALNFSVCYYEILKQPEKACALAKEAFDKAIEQLDSLNDASYKDSTLIMQLLRDNLTIWDEGKDAEETAQ